MNINEQKKIINAAWKAAGYKGQCPMPEASSPEVWDIGGITIEPKEGCAKSLRGNQTVPGFSVTAWVKSYSSEWGEDVSDIDLGNFRCFEDAVVCAFTKMIEDKIRSAINAEGMAIELDKYRTGVKLAY